ncbi:MAG: hypothetical protein FRX49_10749 [Trebouxia sp. A1-2]|nr:MAG: hypothetical protein FRX49_10749 [Trebouxia sp. A1-2]
MERKSTARRRRGVQSHDVCEAAARSSHQQKGLTHSTTANGGQLQQATPVTNCDRPAPALKAACKC